MLTKEMEMEYPPVNSPKETPRYFMSRAKVLLILLTFVSLVAQQNGTQGKVYDGKDDPTGEWTSVERAWLDLELITDSK